MQMVVNIFGSLVLPNPYLHGGEYGYPAALPYLRSQRWIYRHLLLRLEELERIPRYLGSRCLRSLVMPLHKEVQLGRSPHLSAMLSVAVQPTGLPSRQIRSR